MNPTSMSLRRFLRAGVATALLATGMIVAAPAASAAEATVTGSVVDADGAVATSGQVMLFEPEPGVAPQYGDIAADGTFTISAPPGPYYILAIPPDGSDESASAPTDVADQTEVAGTYALETALAFTETSITGSVIDGDGNPVAGAVIIAMDPSSMGGGGDMDMGDGGGGGDMDMGDGGGGQGDGGGDMDMDDGGGGTEFMSSEGAKGSDDSVSASAKEEVEFFSISDDSGDYKLGVPAGTWMIMGYDMNTGIMTPPTEDSMKQVTAGTILEYDITFPTPNVSGTVVDPDGNPYSGAFVMAMQCDAWGLAEMDECWFAGEGGFGATGADGTFVMAVPNSGTYQLEIEPKEGDTSVTMYKEIFTLEEAGEAKATWGTPASATITLVAPNVIGTVTHPVTGLGIQDAWVMAVPAVDRGNGNLEADWSQGQSASGPTSRDDDTGTFTMSLAAGTYVFEIEPPWRNGAGMMRSSEVVVIVDGVNEVNLEIGVPNVQGVFLDSNNDGIQWGWLQLCAAGGGDNGCWLSAPVGSDGSSINGNIDREGNLSVSVHPYVDGSEEMGGSYTLRIEPDQFMNQGASVAEVDITMNSDNSALATAAVDGTSVLQSDGTIVVTAPPPNFSGTVVDGQGNAVGSSRSSWVGVCAEDRTNYTWVGCSGADSDGNFGLTLTASTTNSIRVEPPWDSTIYSLKEYTVVVDSAGVVSSCVDSSDAACPTSGSLYQMALGSPNLLGSITGYSGNADGWIEAMQFQQWGDNPEDGWYEWVAGGQIRGESNFAMSVDDGTYRLKANPGWNMSGVSPAEANVTVSGSTVTCNSGCTAASDGSITMAWGTPNFGGTVTVSSDEGADAAAEAHVEIKIGVDCCDGSGGGPDGTIDYYDWVDWVNANASGAFGASLSDAGTYKIEVHPGWRTTGYAANSYTVVADDDGSGGIAITTVTEDSSSTAISASSGSYALTLAAPNFGGIVTKSDGTAAVDAHVDVFREVTDGGGNHLWWDWAGGAHAAPDSSGEAVVAAFAMLLSADGVYEVEIWPSWTDSDSVNRRTSVTVASNAVTCTVGALGCVQGDDGTFTLSLATSNLAGMLTQSDGTTAVSWSGIEVLEDTNGNPDDGPFGTDAENWVDWMNIGNTTADDTTNFKGNLDAGDYVLIGQPSWSDNESQPTTFAVNVAVDGTTITCSSPCVATENVLAVTLSSGALSGTVTSSSTAVLANGLVFLYNDADGDGHGTLSSNELIRDTATDASGNYSLLIEAGDCDAASDACVVRVQPPPVASGSATDQDTNSAAFSVADNFDLTTVNVTMDAAS